MFTKVINYTDFEGNECSETYYFNLTKLECMDLELMYESEGGLTEYLRSIIKTKNPENAPKKPFIDFVKMFIAKAYGVRQGKAFVKTKETLDEFICSEAYSELVLELLMHPEEFEEFAKKTMPAVPEEELKKAMAEYKLTAGSEV